MKKMLQKYRYSTILLRELVVTDFKLRYQGSVLGYLWSLFKPLLLFVILYIVFVYFLRIGSDIPHWPVAMLLGIVVWNFFAEVTNNGLSAVVNRGDLIRKINFPKYVIILSSSISALINLFLNLIVISIFMIVSGVTITWSAALAPLLFIELFVFALGLAFILSAIYVRLRDMNYIWEVIMQAMFYASVVIYPLSMVMEKSTAMAQLLLLNPVAQVIQDLRFVVVSTANPNLYEISGKDFWLASMPVVVSVMVALYGAWLFRKRSPSFAEEV